MRLLQDAGFGAERVPLSGSAGGSYCGDLTIPLLGNDLTIECKARGNGFASLYAMTGIKVSFIPVYSFGFTCVLIK
ncbi:MAG: hypothetical protein CR217_14430 [Beijerinckiaceae bacterium]|nr:MAG: hypothetical protein CR217_14430 [Beijerinckiaceae bacterium]